MKPHQVENWALQIVEKAETKQPIEDLRVELKADWPKPEKAARRIAGHANASRGATVLWLIGVDEKNGVVGAEQIDLADWFAQVKKQFDGVAPQFIDLNIPYKGKTVVALHFETNRLPFVVKNPTYGQPGGGSVDLEVPWREGTRIRSARRDELLRLLSPLQALPEFEVLKASFYGGMKEETYWWDLHAELYEIIDGESPTVIPFHHCAALIRFMKDKRTVEFSPLRLRPPFGGPRGSNPIGYAVTGFVNLSKTIEESSDEIILRGPGKINLSATVQMEPFDLSASQDLALSISFLPARAEHPVLIDLFLRPATVDDDIGDRWRWEYDRQ